MMDLYDGQQLTENKGGDMDEDGCDSKKNKVLLVFTKITLWWKVVKPWIIDISLWCYKEDIKNNPTKEQDLNKDCLQHEQMVC